MFEVDIITWTQLGRFIWVHEMGFVIVGVHAQVMDSVLFRNTYDYFYVVSDF